MTSESISSERRSVRPTEAGKIVTCDPKHYEAYRLRMQGLKITEIADHFGVSERTIHRWQAEYVEEFRQTFEAEPAANLIAGELAAIDEMERQCVAEAANCVSRRDKYGFLNAALKCRQTRIDLLLKTGVLPKEPDRLYSVMVEKRPAFDESEPVEKSREQLEQEVMDLLKNTRSL